MEEFVPGVIKNGNVLKISPIFDQNNKDLQPDELNEDYCISITNCDNFWPNEPRLINRISSDYGRSHYIFIESSPTIPEATHKYVYKCLGTVTDEERKNFFSSFNIWNDNIVAYCSDFTAERGRILTRTKYELLVSYLQKTSTLSLQKCQLISLYALYLTCQDFLGWLKRCCLNALNLHFPKLKVLLLFFQSNVISKDNQIILTIKFSNEVPKKGCWQCKGAIPTDNKHNVKATFQIDLQKVHQTFGEIEVVVGSKHKYYRKSLSETKKGKPFGIYIANEKKTIKYQDTMPTW